MTRKWISLKVTEQTHQDFKFIAERLGVDIYKFLEALSLQLMDIFSEFKPSGANCFYDVRGSQLIITVFGKSYLVSGMAINDQEVKRQIEGEFKMREDEGPK